MANFFSDAIFTERSYDIFQPRVEVAYEARNESSTHDEAAQAVRRFCWNHPVQLHFVTRAVEGWPKLELTVYGVDVHGRAQVPPATAYAAKLHSAFGGTSR